MAHPENISKRYPTGVVTVTALEHTISLDIGKGEFVVVMGLSGRDKTTPLNIIGGLDNPTEGVIRISGSDSAGSHNSAHRHWCELNMSRPPVSVGAAAGWPQSPSNRIGTGVSTLVATRQIVAIDDNQIVIGRQI